MNNLIIAALSTAFILTGIEELLGSLGKYRGFAALFLSGLAVYFTGEVPIGSLIFTSFAAAFAGLTLSVSVVNLLESRDTRIVKRLPRRVPPL
jgi:hypothetical protein